MEKPIGNQQNSWIGTYTKLVPWENRHVSRALFGSLQGWDSTPEGRGGERWVFLEDDGETKTTSKNNTKQNRRKDVWIFLRIYNYIYEFIYI